MKKEILIADNIDNIYDEINALIKEKKTNVKKVVNDAIISLNWGIGKRLSVELTGNNKPEYGKKIVAEVSKRLEQEYGSGFDKTSISRMIKFYQEFPDFEKVATLSQQLTWSHFVEILPIQDELKRDFYAAMCMQENWSVRTLRERKKSMLYERTAISKKPEETIKNEIAELRDDGKMSLDLFYRDPYMLDFLGLRDTYSEKDLENAILAELEKFILEMGSDFAFLARQKHFVLDGKDYYMDLLFYHRGLRRLVLVELKLGEFEPQDGVILIWPKRPGSWPYEAKGAGKVFAEIANKLAETEKVYMLTEPETEAAARELLCENVEILTIPTDDAWARDVGPTFVTDGKEVRGINWSFNAWGGTYDGLYQDWQKDDKVAEEFCKQTGYDYYDAAPFVLEGGSIHSDGQGTVIATEACLLSKGRNPELTKEQIEAKLQEYLGAEKIIWLPNGIYQDETNEHVDNVCAFIKPGEVVLAWTDDESDPQYALSAEDLKVLEQETDAKGRKFCVHKMPIPKKPVCITEKELAGYVFEEGEDTREAGERLAASYVNFYIGNKVVLVPQFGDEHDVLATDLLQKLFPEREIVSIFAREIIIGGGNIHCITQQIPVRG